MNSHVLVLHHQTGYENETGKRGYHVRDSWVQTHVRFQVTHMVGLIFDILNNLRVVALFSSVILKVMLNKGPYEPELKSLIIGACPGESNCTPNSLHKINKYPQKFKNSNQIWVHNMILLILYWRYYWKVKTKTPNPQIQLFF